jgi:manganese/zinc/iron transport system permease protein
MNPLSFFHDLLFHDHTLQTVVLGSATLGVVSGALGTYAVLRKQSLIGDAISHAALPGIMLAFLLTRSKTPLVLLAGAAAAGWLGTLVVMGIVRSSRIKLDSALGLVLSVFFGFGMVLLTYIQKRVTGANQAGLRDFLWGQAATLVQQDVIVMAVLGAVVLTVMALFWKEFQLLSFDPDFAASLGLPVRALDVLLTGLLVTAIVLGLQAVGVVLMSAMIVAPAAAARQWTDRLGRMTVLSAGFGALAGAAGGVISNLDRRTPTGPMIVLCLGALVALSLLLAPRRGLLWDRVRHWRNRRRLRLEAVLEDLYALAAQHADPDHGHAAAVLEEMSGGFGGVRRSLAELEARGWARRTGADLWALTLEGRGQAERLLRGREQGDG